MLQKLKKNISVFFKKLAVPAMLALSYLLICGQAEAATATIQSLRIGQNSGGIRIVFDTNAKFGYNVFLLSGPRRLVVDFDNVTLSSKVEKSLTANNVLENPRIGRNVDTGASRLAFDLKQPAIIKKAFMLPPQINFGWRFVIDLEITSENDFSKHVGAAYAVSDDGGSSTQSAKNAKSTKSDAAENKRRNAKKIIVLDPGHGGSDVGAIRGDITEKEITLDVSKRVCALLEKKGYTVEMTRDTDKTVSLQDRVAFSESEHPDIFVSIHVNSSEKPEITGIETHYYRQESLSLAQTVHAALASNIKTKNRGLFKSKFYVINHTTAPAILVEIGFISNDGERAELVSDKRKQATAKAIAEGVENYFKENK